MVDQFTDLLRVAVKTRITNQPGLCKNCVASMTSPNSSVAVLFSGGLDSCVLAQLAAEQLAPGQHLHAFPQAEDLLMCPAEILLIQAFKVRRT